MKIIKLQPGEEIIKIVRKHWLPVAFNIVFLLLFAIFSVAVFSALFLYGVIDFNATNIAFSIFTVSSFWLILWIGFFVFWTNYYFDVWIITSHKVVDIEQISFFHREVSEYRIDRIQDITVRVSGLIASWLDFGNVDIQTAGQSSQDFIIRDVPNPHEIKNLIMDIQHRNLSPSQP